MTLIELAIKRATDTTIVVQRCDERPQMLFAEHGIDMVKKQHVASRHLRTEIHLRPATRLFGRATPYLCAAGLAIAIWLALYACHDDFIDQRMRRPLFGERGCGRSVLPARHNQTHTDAVGISVHTKVPPQLEPAPAVQPKQ